MKAIIYIRVSSQMQADEGVSLEAQEAKCRMWCALNGYTVSAVYSDPGISGASIKKRRGLQKALNHLKEGDALVVYSLSRLSRSARDTFDIADLLAKKGADLVSLSEKIDTTSAAGKMVFRMLAVLAEFERDQISERTKAALHHKRSKGEKTGGLVPYGYALKGNKLIIEPSEQDTISKILTMRSEGETMQGIADHLNIEGIPTKMNKEWRPCQVYQILKKETELAA